MATIVLVHGAWHGGWCWERIVAPLRDAGHDALVPTLTGLGDRAHLISPLVGLDTHVEDVVACMDYAGCKDVVLVGHSYGGQVIAGVATRRPDSIGCLVYLDAFVPDDGDCAIDLQPPEIARHYRESVQERGFGWLIPPRSLQVLGVSDPADIAWLEQRLKPHPFKTYTDPAPVSAESLAVPSVFIECTSWMRVFESSAKRAASRGWPVRELETGHEAMVTASDELAAVLDELATKVTR
jgi:pimeloyl-ACP methyl ester carboxylesterase